MDNNKKINKIKRIQNIKILYLTRQKIENLIL